ncbi:hypothetical protein MNB_SM-4-1658 [hydrothermal vent metagenome]|uniref:SnoaL-like domain-containing protein n=1 Tax=hydrothermal vent metagenome TaxID=652676 RepID=A0A1W1BH38_9ZZZZ
MKKIIILSILVVNIFAQDINGILDEYMAAWNNHNKAKIETFYAQNIEWYDLAYDYTTKGKTTVSKAITAAFLDNIENMYWVKSGDVFISENTVTYEWVYGGSSDGKEFAIKGISTTTFDKGKIISQKDYYDMLSLQKALGTAN